MPSKRKSSACVDYVPALCTHRPSLLPIEWSGEAEEKEVLTEITLNNGCLGSRNDEERSEMRYVV
ncbi:unnamed protein product [Bathycoccus prasinos]